MNPSNHLMKLKKQLVKWTLQLYNVIRDPVLGSYGETKESVNIIDLIIIHCQSVINEAEVSLQDNIMYISRALERKSTWPSLGNIYMNNLTFFCLV